MATERLEEVLTTKVTSKEKTSFLYLCTSQGIKPAAAIRALVLEAIEKGDIIKVNHKQTATGEDKPHSKDEDKTGYMAMHGITPMNKHEP